MLHEQHPEQTLTGLTDLALGGSEEAWRQLCDQLKNVVWKTVNTFSLSPVDADDVYAATFFRLAENLAKVRDPQYLPGWIARTARNEALTFVRSRQRLVPIGDSIEETVHVVDPAERLLDDELLSAVYAAFVHLSAYCQKLLRLITAEPPLGYDVIAGLLDSPRGSVGPRRGRCLEQLRIRPELAPFVRGHL